LSKSDFINAAARKLHRDAPLGVRTRSEIARFMTQAAADDGHIPEEPEARRCAVRIADALEQEETGREPITPPAADGSSLCAVRRDSGAEPVFLLITPDRVELRTMAWFTDYESRDAGHSRVRQRRPLLLRILPPGSIEPQIFMVHGDRHHGHAYADGRRFLHCTATITTAPEDPDEPSQHFGFHFWQYDPDLDGNEPLIEIEDVETYALPDLPHQRP